ncbi:hypothetical protein [Lysinibacillus odysseyi]|uniref:Uncharacterized protein n=1 Tax=Lysinibacillus odysseyi 34hs-1 = NBRC 100172 TaxID=1220589 RepID=A0A0A3IFI7_9BACI|nr:hypothetical protein [Lysinibacillus odysseyi]KGR82220.1 hypothetical protein CD32_23370 [Lysinibacillus odysseyi 34hs-1 = NBRC 100172]
MYRTTEERLRALEQEIARQAFQIQLLQNLAANHEKYALYQYVISSNMSENTFYSLQHLTEQYEKRFENGENFSLIDFIADFKAVLTKDGLFLTSSELSELVPKWLGGANGGIGFSASLHHYFYG